MKRFLLPLLLPVTLFGQELDDVVFRLENDPPGISPFSVAGSYVGVHPTHLRTEGFTDRTLTFQQWEGAFSYRHPFNPVCGLLLGAGWVGTEMDLENNTEFHETLFSYVNVLAGAYTTSFPDWLWRVTLAAYLDTDEFSFIDYALYQGVLWGKYDFCNWLELDFGLIVEGGLNLTKVWPIIGFVYTPSERWEISAVYPTDISVNYAITRTLIASTSLRFLRNRHRVCENEPNSQGIFEYRTTGVEFDLTYSPFPCIAITGYAGSTSNGDFKVSDRNNHNAIHYKFKGSFYAGATALWSF